MAAIAAAVISALASLAGAGLNLYSGNKAAQDSAEQMNKYRAALAADKEEAKAREQYYENVSPLDTKTGRALSTEMAQQLADVNAAAAGRNAVSGGQGFNTAATKNATAQLMAEYNRSLIKAHESNIVPQLNYYRSLYNTANQASRKAQYDQAIAGIKAASEAWKGVGAAINAGGAAAAGFLSQTPSGNGTQTGDVGQKFDPNVGQNALDNWKAFGEKQFGDKIQSSPYYNQAFNDWLFSNSNLPFEVH